MTADCTILVCCHKQDYCYHGNSFLPVHVGKALHKELDLGIDGDDTGCNISCKNPNFCELTAHYWFWKNHILPEFVGLNHYRRYFVFGEKLPMGTSVYRVPSAAMSQKPPTLPDLKEMFSKYDIVLAKPEIYPYSLYVDYCVAHIQEDFKILQTTIHDLSPEYDESFYQVMYLNNRLSHYNMFIMRKEDFNEYSEWMFRILFEVERRVKISLYTSQARIFGYMSERLLNVFVHKKRMKVKFAPVVQVIEDRPNYKHLWLKRIRTNIVGKIFIYSKHWQRPFNK